MSGTLLEELCPALSDIARKCNFETFKEERSKSFDNAIVELSCDEFAARVVRDRGTVSIDLSPLKNQKWTSLETVLSFLGESLQSQDPEDLSGFLEKNFGKIAALMTSKTDGLDAFEKDRSAKFIQKIFLSS